MKLVARLVLAVMACSAAAQAQPRIDVARFDMHPLAQIHAAGSDLAGNPFEVDLFVYRGGPTFLAYSAETGNAQRVARAVATPRALMALNQAFAAGRVGQQRGGCGSPVPDQVETRVLTWYGKQRGRTIPVGGDYSDCPADLVRLFDAVCEFVWETLGPTLEYCVPPA